MFPGVSRRDESRGGHDDAAANGAAMITSE